MRSYLSSLGSLAAVGSLVAGFSCSAHDTVKTSPVSYADTTDAELEAARTTLAKTPLGKVVAKDEHGAGRYVMASPAANAARLKLQPEAATRLHLERHARMLGLSEAAVRGAVFKGWHAMSSGAGVAQFEQRIDGVEVFRGRASVLVDASNQLVSISNSMAGVGARHKVKGNAFPLAAETALAAAYSSHSGVGITADEVRDQGESGPARSYAVNTPPGAMHVVSATAKKVFFPVNDVLEGAYYVEILGNAHGSRENDARAYVIAATDGRILHDQSLTMHDSFNYRVWADPTGLKTPLDGPIADTTPHPTGQVDGFKPAFVDPVMVSMEGFNKNKDGTVDPWLKPTDTYTFGNNVNAYSDRNGGGDGGIISTTNGWQDNTSDLRAETTSPMTFDRTYDLNAAPNSSPDQIKAAVTQLFYTNNWLHDFWYNSGFDELANNAQLSNYGRGGAERDPLLCEAQDAADSGQSNNANMSPLGDGTSPRMQMYVWTGVGNRALTTTPAITISDSIGASGYGPQQFDLPATAVILANDNSTVVMAGTTGVGTFTDACQALPADVAGKIVVAERGGCNFTAKSVNAQNAKAVGIILLNNAPGNAAPSPGGADPSITIPLLGLSQEDGAKLKAAMTAGPVTATLKRGAETMRDGTIDNTIVAHEWGHYFHHRLVQCSSASCNGMSEGWGDFVAVMMSVREGDTFDDKIYALSQYSTAGFSRDGAYFGIRRAPYSKSKTKNPFTFGHIRQMSTLPTTAPLAPAGADMSEVHNVGEIWAQALFEAYANLIEA
ncbi:MAG: M36 family metallopeptidase, partial [Polyangiaceae bacterium]